MAKNRVILHIDGDAFFVAVEQAKNPKLKGKPVVTGEERGIVSALSYEAKALGVQRGIPIFRLKKEFPTVIILPGDYDSYEKYSGKMMEIVRRYADDVEEYSIDECFADLTGFDKPLKMFYEEIAKKIKKEILDELLISTSVGLAPTKCLAKVASKWIKPNGFTVITKDNLNNFLKDVPIEKVWGIGPATSIFLKKKGINTAKDFIDLPITWIKENLSSQYEVIYEELRGNYLMNVDPKAKTEYKSIQKTKSFFPSTNDESFLFSELSKHAEDAFSKARYYGLSAKKFSFFIKDKSFKYHRMEFTLPVITSAPESAISIIEKSLKKLIDKRLLYRATGITIFELRPSDFAETDLFGEKGKAEKFEAIHKQIDSLEEKFGPRIVHLASTHKSAKKKKIGSEANRKDRNLLFL